MSSQGPEPRLEMEHLRRGWGRGLPGSKKPHSECTFTYRPESVWLLFYEFAAFQAKQVDSRAVIKALLCHRAS